MLLQSHNTSLPINKLGSWTFICFFIPSIVIKPSFRLDSPDHQKTYSQWIIRYIKNFSVRRHTHEMGLKESSQGAVSFDAIIVYKSICNKEADIHEAHGISLNAGPRRFFQPLHFLKSGIFGYMATPPVITRMGSPEWVSTACTILLNMPPPPLPCTH